MPLVTDKHHTIIYNLVVAAIYMLLAQSGILFRAHDYATTLWWPCGGFALAILLLYGIPALPGVLLGAFLSSINFGDSWEITVAFTVGNAVEAILGRHILSRLINFDIRITRLRDFLTILYGAPFIALVSAIANSTALLLSNTIEQQSWIHIGLHWWMADLLGIVLFTPLILVWWHKPNDWLTPMRVFEAILLIGLTFIAGQIIFLNWYHEYLAPFPKAFMMFLLVSLTAIRLGPHGVLIILIITSVQALVGAIQGIGYFGDDIVNTHLTNFWLYTLIMSISGMTLACYINEKKQIVSELKESENRFRTLANNTSVLVWMSDTNALCTYFNQVWLDFTGRTLEQELGNGWKDSVHPDDLQYCLNVFMTAFDKRQAFSMEYRLRRHDGVYRWVYDQGVPLYDSQEKFVGYIGSLFDITERKNAEMAMYDSEIRFRKLLDKIPLVSVQGYAEDGTTNYWNQASEHLYGYTKNEALGQKLTDLIIPPEMREGVREAMREMFKTGEPIPASELRLMKKDGGPVDVFSSHAYVHVPGREPEMFCMDIDLTERKRDEENIRNLAFYDPLTQLPNRRLLMDRLQQALTETNRSGHHGALLFFDLDNFKTLNDTLGHDKGDLLLQQVAKRLSANIRKVDIAARLGGDEFVVILKDLSKNPDEAPFQAETTCAKILAALNEPYLLDDSEYQNTTSIGITLFIDHQTTIEDLMKRADIAMYQAKHAGCNTFRFFDPQMQSAVEVRSVLENGLRKAIHKNQLHLHYQQQVDELGHIHGAEVLVRWLHPERGLISPAEFIPLAEETGLIIPIGLWVLETACLQLRRWRDDPQRRQLQLAVNVSARQFRQTNFSQQVTDILTKTGALPSNLKLELTESALLDNIEDTIEKMKQLKLLGVQLSMDDFGTGYSSLSFLRKLPIDQLKIDQSFVRNITTNPDEAVIVQTIIAMAHNLGMEVIAEGVETEQQKAFLIQHNCRNFQGYLFGKPIPIEQFEALI